jgi:hypothetical protein
MRWMKGLKFSDGYAAGLRRSVNMMMGKLLRLKSHYYHIIMERPLPVTFRGYFDDVVWMVLAELSYFYRQLCAKEITVEMMQKLEKEILVLLCKMEKFFPPGFSIQCNISLYISHMKLKWVVLFSIGGCITLKEPSDLKPMVSNRARVEGCIAEAFIIKEVAYFSSVYFPEEHNVNAPMMRYNIDEEPPYSDLSIFASRGTTVGSSMSHYSISEERKTVLLYMYANIDVLDKYFE